MVLDLPRKWLSNHWQRLLVVSLVFNSLYFSLVVFDATNDTQMESSSILASLEASASSRASRTTISGESLEVYQGPTNLHKGYPLKCGARPEHLASSASGLFEMVHGYLPNRKYNTMGHRNFKGPLEKGVKELSTLQICSYAALDRFWKLADEYNITRWSAHGGTIMGALCHGSINPWDDDIDITVSSCNELDEVFSKSESALVRFPKMNPMQHSITLVSITGGKKKHLIDPKVLAWEGRALDNDWLLLKGYVPRRRGNWYKLKSVIEATELFPNTRELGGMDIMCFDRGISYSELFPMESSGFEASLKGKDALPVVDFGPTKLMMVPENVATQYVRDRYEKKEFCDFPFGREKGTLWPITKDVPLSKGASQATQAVSQFYVSPTKRKEWLEKVGTMAGNELNKEIRNLDYVEVDNQIAPPQSCKIEAGRPLRTITWNAAGGTYWAEFAEIVKSRSGLEEADVIILNEMDIGMARSGNVHTARKMAFHLGMNYAWGLEFVELTNGNRAEQKVTTGLRNLMGLQGSAILSRCQIFDPMQVRDPLDERYFSHEAVARNDMGSVKRLGGSISIFVRTGKIGGKEGIDRETMPQYAVVGSLRSEMQTEAQQKRIKEYFGLKSQSDFGNLRANVVHIVAAASADEDGRTQTLCTRAGLTSLGNLSTYPADCTSKDLGNATSHHFCGVVNVARKTTISLPCYSTPKKNRFGGLQLSKHAIIAMEMQ